MRACLTEQVLRIERFEKIDLEDLRVPVPAGSLDGRSDELEAPQVVGNNECTSSVARQVGLNTRWEEGERENTKVWILLNQEY